MDPIEQIFGGKKKKFEELDLIRIHQDFMYVYGWIPPEQFVEIPNPMVLNLNKFVQEEKRKQEMFRLGLMRLLGYKGKKL